MSTLASRSRFTRFATAAARAAGKPVTCVIAAGMIVAWVACGPLFDFSNTWQLVVNTATTIVTFRERATARAAARKKNGERA